MNVYLARYTAPVLLMLFGMVSIQAFAASSAADDVHVINPYVRAVPPGQPNSAAFMQLQNKSASQHAIVRAQSPIAQRVELHTHLMEDGMMKMRQIKQIDVPAKGKTSLKPGGLHVMFLGLKSALTPGQSVPITLIYEDGSKTTIHAPVRKMKMHMQQK